MTSRAHRHHSVHAPWTPSRDFSNLTLYPQVLSGDLDEGNLADISDSIADSCGLPVSLVEIDPAAFADRRSARREPISVTFRLFVDSSKEEEIKRMVDTGSFASILAEELHGRGVSATLSSMGECECSSKAC